MSSALKVSRYVSILKDDMFNTIQDEHFWGCTQMGMGVRGEGGGAKRPKICHTYPTMMKLGRVILYAKKIQKMYQSCDTPPEAC